MELDKVAQIFWISEPKLWDLKEREASFFSKKESYTFGTAKVDRAPQLSPARLSYMRKHFFAGCMMLLRESFGFVVYFLGH